MSISDAGVLPRILSKVSPWNSPAEPNDFHGIASEQHLAVGLNDNQKWNDEGGPGVDNITGFVVEYDVSTVIVETGDDQVFFDQSDQPDSDNPLTAGYQEVLVGGTVSIDCCRVLDTREGAGKGKKYGDYLPSDFDLGLAVANTDTNPTCVDMPTIAMNTAILRLWQRGVPESMGISSDGSVREHDLGVCVIQANVEAKGVVFSAEEAKNVLGYSMDCAEKDVEFRPFTGGVTISAAELEVYAPNVTSRTADCDGSRSAKRYSDNVMVLNLRHYTKHNATKRYLSRLAAALKDSIEVVKLEGCVDNMEGFLDNLTTLVTTAKKNFAKKGVPLTAVEALDNATRLALLIPGTIPLPVVTPDPYGACPGNPKGLFVGRLMSLKFAVCSELERSGAGENAQSPGACKIAGDDTIPTDIFAEMPPLP